MAQRTSKPPGGGATPPSVEQVRLALAHLAELAAAFEGRGVELSRATQDEDLEALAAVTETLLTHRAGQRQHQTNLVHGLAVNLVADVYRASEDSTAFDLQNRLIEEFGKLQIELSDEDLNALVIAWDVDQDEVRRTAAARSTGPSPPASSGSPELTIKLRGAVEAAKKTVGALLGRGTRTLHDVKQAVDNTPPIRASFGRWVGAAARNAYVDDLRAAWAKEPAATPAGTPLSNSLGALKELGEARGAAFDLLMEEVALTSLTTTEGLLSLVTSDSESPTLNEARRQFEERWTTRSTLLLLLVGTAPDDAESRLALIPALSDQLREATLPLITALKTADEAAAWAALPRFNAAVAFDVLESARKHHTERLLALRRDS